MNRNIFFSSSAYFDTVASVNLEKEDIDIIKLVLAGEVDSYRHLVEKYMQFVSAIVSRRIPHSDVRDVAHDVFVRAYNSLSSFKQQSPFEHWLAKIAVRECYDHWRRDFRNAKLKQNLISVSEESIDSFNQQERKKAAVDQLNKALEKLSPENRAVITLVHLEGYSIEATAELLGWSKVNVKVRAHRAREQLREILKQQG